jgi:hypothetical protein
MPNLVDDPSVRKKVLDAIGDYYEQLATTTNEFVARMVHSAIGTLDERAAQPAAKRAAHPAAKRAVAAKPAAKRAVAAKSSR